MAHSQVSDINLIVFHERFHESVNYIWISELSDFHALVARLSSLLVVKKNSLTSWAYKQPQNISNHVKKQKVNRYFTFRRYKVSTWQIQCTHESSFSKPPQWIHWVLNTAWPIVACERLLSIQKSLMRLCLLTRQLAGSMWWLSVPQLTLGLFSL